MKENKDAVPRKENDQCGICNKSGFDLFPKVLQGDDQPTDICEWCLSEKISKELKGIEQFDDERERELGIGQIIDTDRETIDREDIPEERRPGSESSRSPAEIRDILETLDEEGRTDE